MKKPTRDEYLLDLVISDVSPRAVEVLPAISDHNMVLAEFNFGVTDAEYATRTVFE